MSQRTATPERWTIGRLLEWTTGYLKEHGSSTARLDAEVLLAHARGCRRIDLYTAFDSEPTEPQRNAFRALVRKRADGCPVAYLVGHREFYSLEFRVTPDVLIPRPETELLVVRLADLGKSRRERELWVADVGTGSGILAVCAARQFPQARVVAIDISAAAIEVARQNAIQHGVDARITFVQSNLFQSVEAGRQFDFIISNPPYVRTSEFAGLPRDVAEHEPRQALEAGPLGTEVIAPLVEQSAMRLRPGGHLLCEISPMLREPVAALFSAGAWQDVRFLKDHAGLVRAVQARVGVPSRGGPCA